jgi:putative spermidine/putrescine transport system permease protein
VHLTRRQLAAVLVAPALAYAVYLVLPALNSARLSFEGFGLITGVQEIWTLEQYHTILHDPYYLHAWLSTIVLATEGAALSLAAGSAIAYFLWRVGGRLRVYLTAVVISPMLVSGVVRAYGWIAITGPQGTLPDLTERMGLGRVSVMYDQGAVLIGFVNVFSSLVVIMLLVQLDTIQPSVIRAAANIGAGTLSVAYRILLPLCYRVMVSAFLLVFALATASYALPAILGGGRILTIASIIYQEENVTLNWPRGAAVGLTLTVVTIAIMLSYQVLAGRRAQVAGVVRG